MTMHPKRIVPIAILLLCLPFWISCHPRNPHAGSPSQSSVAQTEIDPARAINWSTVTNDEIWTDVFNQYGSNGPRYALSLLDSAMGKGVISTVEGEQVKAGFLYDLGRIDEAFLSLSIYKLDESHPDLLRLRGELLWNMGRYDEAGRDYDEAIDAYGSSVSPEVLFAAERLCEDSGAWDKAAEMRSRIKTDFPQDFTTLRLDFEEALQSEDPDAISSSIQLMQENGMASVAAAPLSAVGRATVESLRGDSAEGCRISREYIMAQGFDLSVAMTLLRLDIEAGDFEGFQSDLRICFEKLGAVGWIDTAPDVWPQPTDHPQAVAKLLDWASTFELGRGDRDKALLYTNRALALDPYDYSAQQQLAIVQISSMNPTAGLQSLADALKVAPPSDVRVRTRILQLTPLAGAGMQLPWDNEDVASQLDSVLQHREQQFPRNAFFRSAHAELEASKGDFDSAERIAQEACALPGATRDMRLRSAYYLVRLGRTDEAWAIVQQQLSSGAPYLTWANVLMQESAARSDQALGEFAMRVRSLLDPDNSSGAFFEKPTTE